jgi:hypothetical protein
MIKLLNISVDKRKKIESHFTDEISSSLIDRQGFHQKCAKWRKNFEGEPDREIKNFPWEKASNLIVPIQAITANAFVANQYNSMFQVPPFWTVKPKNSQWADHASPTQNCLEHYQKEEMKLSIATVPWMYDKCNIGTGIAKQIWVSERIRDKQYSDSGDIITTEYLDDGPRFIIIAIEDFLFATHSIQDIQLCPWVAHRFRITWDRIRSRSRKVEETGQPIYINTEELESKFVTRGTERIEKAEDIEKVTRTIRERVFGKEHELFEVWGDYDFDEDGITEKVCFTFHNASEDGGVDLTLVRPILNPWMHRLRPFLVDQCFPRPHRILGIGYGQRLERLQEGLTTTANQAIDNWSVANARCITYKKGLGIKTPFKIWPGRAFAVNEHTDISAFQLGDIYDSGQLIINFLKDISERITGVSDYWLGKESSTVGSSATATSTLALMQQGNKLFDFLMRSSRNTLNESAYMLYMNLKQMKPTGAVYSVLGEQEGQFVEETWMAREGDVRKCLEFDLTSSSAYSNRMVERQSWIEYFQLVLGYYEKIFDASGVFFAPEAPLELKMVIAEMIMSAHLIMKRISQQWDIKDIDRILYDPQMLISMEFAKMGLGGGQGGEGPNAGGSRGFGRFSQPQGVRSDIRGAPGSPQ